MVNKRQKFGKAGESIAARQLIKEGYRILEQNYRTAAGEIDIIARDGDTLVFIEVKARTSNRYGSAKHAVTFKKQKKIAEDIINQFNTEQVYNNPIVTEVTPFDIFYVAEDYHKNYYELNTNQPYCQLVVAPKVEKFQKIFKDKLKK